MEIGGQSASPGPGESSTMVEGVKRGRWVREREEIELIDF